MESTNPTFIEALVYAVENQLISDEITQVFLSMLTEEQRKEFNMALGVDQPSAPDEDAPDVLNSAELNLNVIDAAEVRFETEKYKRVRKVDEVELTAEDFDYDYGSLSEEQLAKLRDNNYELYYFYAIGGAIVGLSQSEYEYIFRKGEWLTFSGNVYENGVTFYV